MKNYPSQCTQVLPQSTADAVNDVLRGVQENDGFGALNGLQLDQPSAAKTGTTQEGKSVWFMGYTPELATAAMIAGANSDGTPFKLAGQVIGGDYISTASGSGFAGPMWGDAMQVIDKWLPYADFVKPDARDVRGVQTVVPDTAGMGLRAGRRRCCPTPGSPRSTAAASTPATARARSPTPRRERDPPPPAAARSRSSSPTARLRPPPAPTPSTGGGDTGGGGTAAEAAAATAAAAAVAAAARHRRRR